MGQAQEQRLLDKAVVYNEAVNDACIEKKVKSKLLMK